MNAHLCLLLMTAVPFWQAKPSSEWTLDEVRTLLTDSPWAQMVDAGKDNPAPAVQIYVAGAEPIIAAEDRLRAARKSTGEDPSWQEYRDYLVENAGKYIVLAIRVLKAESFLDNSETKHMEDDSYLLVGKRKYKVTGHFPPSSTDPYARLVFPRELQPGDRVLTFDLYIPGAGSPYRQAQFSLKEMIYRGKPAY
jgi:hypothetical protein